MTDAINNIEELKDRLGGRQVAMLSTVDERGTLSSRPVTVQEITSDGDLWFLVGSDADWVTPSNGGAVNAAITTDSSWVSFAGRVDLSADQADIDRLMDEASKTFFADGTEPIALRVVTDRIEWWAAPNKAVQLFELAKARLTDSQPDLGTSGTIET